MDGTSDMGLIKVSFPLGGCEVCAEWESKYLKKKNYLSTGSREEGMMM